MKRFTAFILSVIILICSAVCASASDAVTYGFITYTPAYLKDADGNFGNYYKASSCLSLARGSITVKSDIDGVPVVELAKELFCGIMNITSVTVPETVAKIGDSAFEDCSSLETVIINSEKCQFGKSCFRGCTSLKSVNIPAKLNSIPQATFSGCISLSSAVIPETVEAIGNEAFSLCSSITEMNIPAAVSLINQNAFSNCSGIKEFTVDGGNTSYKTIEKCLYSIDGKTLIQYPNACGKTEFTVPGGTEVIGDYALGANSALTKINLPAGIKTLSDYAFYSDTALSDIVIPDGTEYIGSMAFAKCPNLKSIVIPKSVETYEGAFYQSGIESVILESGIKAIDTKAFEKCASLKEINIPSSVEAIGLGAFDGCSSLKTVDIPASVKSIGKNAFIKCPYIILNVAAGSAAQAYADENSIPYTINGRKALRSLSVASAPAKTNYNYKSTLDTTGLSLKAVYSDGSSETVSSGFTVSPDYFDSVGTKKITVQYGGETCFFNVNVSYAWWQTLIRILLLGFLWY